jgi:hypothetical protein
MRPAREPNARRFAISLGGRNNGRSGRAGRRGGTVCPGAIAPVRHAAASVRLAATLAAGSGVARIAAAPSARLEGLPTGIEESPDAPSRLPGGSLIGQPMPEPGLCPGEKLPCSARAFSLFAKLGICVRKPLIWPGLGLAFGASVTPTAEFAEFRVNGNLARSALRGRALPSALRRRGPAP